MEVGVVFDRVGVVGGEIVAVGDHVVWAVQKPWCGFVRLCENLPFVVVVALLGTVDVWGG